MTPQQTIDILNRLSQARVDAETAQGLLTIHKEWLKEVNTQFPPKTFGLNKRERDKERSHIGALVRLQNAIAKPGEIENRIQWAREQEEAQQKAKLEKAKEETIAIAKAQKLDRAIAYLLRRGKVFGQDFNAGSALPVADQVAFKEAIAERMAKDEFVGFDGSDNCDEDCQGWDGESHRCTCGNRRVEWYYDGDFEDMTLYATAY